jgi:hypothetical protein
MDLKSMLLPQKVVSFDFPGCDGLKFDLAFLSKESNQVLFKKCQTTEYDKKTRSTVDKFDDEKFLELYVKAIIKGWSGLKLEYLKDLVLVEVPSGQENILLPYTEENALDLMKNSTIFDNWVTEVISDLGNFTSSDSISKLIESNDTSKKAEAA